jgi:hypothetical protein
MDYPAFNRLVNELEDWYRDGVQAQAYDGSPGTHHPGHRILRSQPYPGPNWRRLWAESQGPENDRAIIESIEAEIYGLSHGPSRSGPASGLHHGTVEWKLAVATAPGTLRSVARTFGVSHTTVRTLRKEIHDTHQ